jgi:cell division protein FtsB
LLVDNVFKLQQIAVENTLFLSKLVIQMKNIISIIKNKYLLTVIGLSIWVIFFDRNDLKTELELRREVMQLEEERNYFAREIHSITSDIKELYTNPKTLEKFAREKYLMKRDNEEIFVIVEEEKQ